MTNKKLELEVQSQDLSSSLEKIETPLLNNKSLKTTKPVELDLKAQGQEIDASDKLFDDQDTLNEEQVLKIIKGYIREKLSSAQIGLFLRDEHNLMIPKLCKFARIDPLVQEIERLSLKLRKIRLHLDKNKKDLNTRRVHRILTVKLGKLNNKLKKN